MVPNDTAHARALFFTTLADTNNRAKAAIAGGYTINQVNWLYANDAGFADGFDKAVTVALSKLEDVAYERATVGRKVPIIRRGKGQGAKPEIVGYDYVPDNRMLEILLKANFPTKYNPQRDDKAAQGVNLTVVQFGEGGLTITTPDGQGAAPQALPVSTAPPVGAAAPLQAPGVRVASFIDVEPNKG